MKTLFKIILLIILFLFTTYMISVIVSKVKQKKIITEKIQIIPQFTFLNVISQNFYTNDSIEDLKSCLIIYYNSECEHCQYEAELISKQIEQFKDYQILMISYEPIEKILAYRKKFKLNYSFIEFLQDSKYQFDNIFGNSPFPSSFIYNKNRKLVKQFKGEVKTEAMLKYLAK